MNRYGELVVPCQYDWIEHTLDSVVPLQLEGKYGFLYERETPFIVPCEYDELDEYDFHLYARKGDQWGLFDLEGHFVPTETPEEENMDRYIPYTSYVPIFQWADIERDQE